MQKMEMGNTKTQPARVYCLWSVAVEDGRRKNIEIQKIGMRNIKTQTGGCEASVLSVAAVEDGRSCNVDAAYL